MGLNTFQYDIDRFSDPYGLGKLQKQMQAINNSYLAVKVLQNPFVGKGVLDMNKVLTQSIKPIYSGYDWVEKFQKQNNAFVLNDTISKLYGDNSLAKIMKQSDQMAKMVSGLNSLTSLHKMVMQYDELSKSFTNCIAAELAELEDEDVIDEKIADIETDYRVMEAVVQDSLEIEHITPKSVFTTIKRLLAEKAKTKTGKVFAKIIISILPELIIGLTFPSTGISVSVDVPITINNQIAINSNNTEINQNITNNYFLTDSIAKDTNQLDNDVIISNEDMKVYQKGTTKSKMLFTIEAGTEISVMKRNRTWWLVMCMDNSGKYFVGYINSKLLIIQ